MLNVKEILDVEFDGVDWSDYPDFSDALVVSATWSDGRELTEAELDELNDSYGDFVYSKLINKLF